eukprot:Nk52_evm4s1636 gene=Nk52_evmTU4s1636
MLLSFTPNVFPIPLIAHDVKKKHYSHNFNVTVPQFPILVGKASTIHKLQARTITEDVVFHNVSKAKIAQVYTALTRVTRLESIFITSGTLRIDASKWRYAEKVREELARLESLDKEE